MIDILGNAYGPSGFAQHVRLILLGLHRIGAKGIRFVQGNNVGSLDLATSETIDAIMHYQTIDRNSIATKRLFITQPPALPNITKDDILYFPWEPCSLPKLSKVPYLIQRPHSPFHLDWTIACEMAKGIIGTSKYCEDVYRMSSHSSNILGHVYPPVDQAIYNPTGPKVEADWFEDTKDSYKVLIVGKWEPRKNIPNTIINTSLALQNTDSIIILKTTVTGNSKKDMVDLQNFIREQIKNRIEFSGIVLPKIMVITEAFTEDQMAILYRSCDLTLLLSHGEGFGYPAAQSLFVGTDVIATNGSALPEILDNDPDRLVDADRAPIIKGDYAFFHSSMDWFYPSIQDSIKKITAAFLDHKTARRKRRTKELSERARKIFTPEESATKLLDILNRV